MGFFRFIAHRSVQLSLRRQRVALQRRFVAGGRVWSLGLPGKKKARCWSHLAFVILTMNRILLQNGVGRTSSTNTLLREG